MMQLASISNLLKEQFGPLAKCPRGRAIWSQSMVGMTEIFRTLNRGPVVTLYTLCVHTSPLPSWPSTSPRFYQPDSLISVGHLHLRPRSLLPKRTLRDFLRSSENPPSKQCKGHKFKPWSGNWDPICLRTTKSTLQLEVGLNTIPKTWCSQIN